MSTHALENTFVKHHAPSPQRILVAIDDSDPSRWAVQVAGEFAQRLEARVLLVHVVRPSTAVLEIPITAEELDEGARRKGAALLRRVRELLPASIDCDCLQLVGVPADEIVLAAENSDVQLIVMGTRGAGRLSHFLLGSTAEAVIRQAPCPVLTVAHEPRPHEAACAGKGEACRVS